MNLKKKFSITVMRIKEKVSIAVMSIKECDLNNMLNCHYTNVSAKIQFE